MVLRDGYRAVTREKREAQKKKAPVIAACVRQQQSALDLCAFCRWTATRLVAVWLAGLVQRSNRFYALAFGGSTFTMGSPHAWFTQMICPLGRVYGIGVSHKHADCTLCVKTITHHG